MIARVGLGRGRAWRDPPPVRWDHPAAVGSNGTARSPVSYWVASRDLRSPLHIAAESIVIFALALLTGIGYHLAIWKAAGSFEGFAATGLIVAFLFACVSRLLDDRHAAALTTRFDRLRNAVLAWSLAFAALFFVLFAFKVGNGVSRGSILAFYVTGIAVVGLWRTYLPRTIARIVRGSWYGARDCIILADESCSAAGLLADELIASGLPRPTMLTFRAGCDESTWPAEHSRLMTATVQAAQLLRRGEIYICASGVQTSRLTSIQRALSILPRAIYVIPEPRVSELVRSKISAVGTHVAIEVHREPLGLFQRTIKRLTDVCIAAALLVILAPWFCIVAMAIKFDSRGPVFFRQTRNGCHGRPFHIIKFRTMTVQEDGPNVDQVRRNDPRVTRLGRFLRKWSIDELPQLLNVLRGDMSLVGPRPHATVHDDIYAKAIENYPVRQHVKPGITGWAQVNGLRGGTPTLDFMYRRIELDLWYAVNASLLLDFEILVRTFFEMFRQRNAY
ncbi:MAG: exopolysaccharide biosynthesis polyprenyl glycosylphosphotransferase [Rhizomicrobium sp.]